MLVGAGWRRRAAHTVAALMASTGTMAVVAVAAPMPVAAAGFTCAGDGPSYEVVDGDSWYWIAEKLDLRVSELLDANSATTDDLLLVGDRLCLPGGSAAATGCGQRYAVRSGDGWYQIADRTGVSVTALTGANDAELTTVIHPGQQLCLPNGATMPADAAAPGSSSAAGGSSPSGGSYTVARGDGWSTIADRAEVTMGALLAQNGASSTDVIVPGQVLQLPPGAKQPAAVPPVILEAAATQGPCGYGDTWGEARSSTRRHKGTDIFTRHQAYVYAVVDGRLTGRVWDGAGRNAGNAWTLTGADGTKFFYAHLADFNPELKVGSRVQAGEILGWVGGTGNASADHLHLEIRPRGGEAVNPYPILRAQSKGCHDGRPYTQPSGWVPD